MRHLTGTVRYRYLILTGWAAACGWFIWHRINSTDFSLIVGGGHIITGGHYPSFHMGPLSLYAELPFLRIGPPVLLLNGGLVRLVGPHTAWELWSALIMVAGLVAVRVIERTMIALSVSNVEWRTLAGGTVVIAGWAEFVHVGHLEDAVALACVALAVAWIGERRAWWLPAAALGFGIACKPWVLMMAPLLLALPGRERVRASSVTVLAAAVWWLPFIIGDAGTLHALSSWRPAAGERSVLWLAGYMGNVAPSGIDTLEMLAGVGFAVVAWLRGRWLAIPLAAMAARLIFEPQFLLYYMCGLLLAAWLWDACRSRLIPVWLLSAAVVGFGFQQYASPTLGAAAQLAFAVAVIVGVSLPVRSARRSPAPVEPLIQVLSVADR